MSATVKTRLIYAVKWLGSLGLLAWLFSQLDFERIKALSSEIHVGFLLLIFSLLFMERVLIAARWPILVRLKGHPLRFRDAFAIDWISSFFGMALPSLLSSDAIRGYRLFRLTNDLKTSVSSIVLDRIIGVATLGLTAVVSLFLGWKIFGIKVALGGLGVFIVITGTGFFMATSTGTGRAITRMFPSIHGTRLWNAVVDFQWDITQYRSSRTAIPAVFAMSLGTQVMRVLVTYAAALAIGSDISFFYFVLFVPVVFTVKMLPISIGGIGAREATFGALYAFAGRPTEEGILVGLVISVVTTLYAAIGGLVYLIQRSDRPLAPAGKEPLFELEVKQPADR